MEFRGFNDWVPIFRGGKQTDSKGNEHDGNALIDKALATFNPAYHEPPAVIGHPKEDAPAYGWVSELKKIGDTLHAKFRQVAPGFEQAVKDGLFKKRSAAFYPDGRLRHVGFLGAMPPAVKGLADVKFKEGEEYIEFASSSAEHAAQEARAKKYSIGIKDGGNVTKPGEWKDVPDDEFLDPVNYRYPCPDADQTRAAASYWGQRKNQEEYTQDERSVMTGRLDTFRKKFGIGQSRKEDTKMTFKELKEKLVAVFTKAIQDLPEDGTIQASAGKTFSEADVEAAKKQAAEDAAKKEREKVAAEFAEKERTARQEARKKEISAWCEAMVKEGRLTPALVKFGVPEMLNFLASSEEVIEFGETKEKALLFDRFKALFEKEIPKLITFGEVATRDRDTGGGNKRDAAIAAFMEKNKDASYKEAVLSVSKDNPELFKEEE